MSDQSIPSRAGEQQTQGPLDFFLQLVRDGIIVVKPDGSVWRRRIFTKYGTAPVAERRIDPVRVFGYRWVHGRLNGRQYSVPARRLVWAVLRGPIPPKMVVDHLDSDRTNNHPSNLEVVTQSENVRHSHRAGRRRNRKRRLPPELEQRIADLRATGLSYRQIEAKTGISQSWCRQLLKKYRCAEVFSPFTFVA